MQSCLNNLSDFDQLFNLSDLLLVLATRGWGGLRERGAKPPSPSDDVVVLKNREIDKEKHMCDNIDELSSLLATSQGGGLTTCKFDGMLVVFLLYLHIPTRTRNKGVRA